MCGIAGYVGSIPPSIDKMKILGIYNVTRGKDSCGFFYNGKVVKGVSQNKIFSDFIEKDEGIIKKDESSKDNVFLLHTRQGTAGAATIENAHPHLINDRAVLVHNGTIENIWELCNKYEIDHSSIHNDSYALGLLIDKVGFSILNEYIGFAAILYHKIDEPNTLYFYKGASKNFNFVNSEVVEERPLFILCKEEGGYYFSSLENSLLAIRDSEEEYVFPIECNKVYKIVGDEWTNEVVEIDRELNNTNAQKKTTVSQNRHPYSHQTSTTGTTTATTTKQAAVRVMLPANVSPIQKEVNKLLLKTGLDINYETLPKKINSLELQSDPYVFFRLGRYWVDKELADGILYLNKDGIICTEKNSGIYPYHFYKGILIRNEKTYKELLKILQAGSAYSNLFNNDGNQIPKGSNFAAVISRFSKYPITNIGEEAKNVLPEIRNGWYNDCLAAGGSVTPLFSDRNYTFRNGLLTNITNNRDRNDVIFFNPSKGTNKYQNIQYSEEVSLDKQLSINTCFAFFNKVYTVNDNLFDILPTLVWDALEIYFDHVVKTSGIILSREDKSEQIKFFTDTCVEDGLTFFENTDETITDVKIKEFLGEAYDRSLKKKLVY